MFMASSEHITFILNIQKVKLFFQQIQTGLIDTETVITIAFDYPLTARYIRVNPVGWKSWPSFRFELIGCRMYFHCLIICIIFSSLLNIDWRGEPSKWFISSKSSRWHITQFIHPAHG